MEQKILDKNNMKKILSGIHDRFVSKKDISESTGDATDKVMSQKAVSNEFNRLYGLTEGSAWETKPYTGDAYMREIPKNSKIASVDMIGGKSFVWNQIVKWDQSNPSSVTGPASMSVTHDGEVYTGTRVDSNASIGFSSMVSDEIIGGHVYYFACDLKVTSTAASMLARFSYSAVFDAQSITYAPGSWTHLQAVQKAVASPSKISLALYVDIGAATKAGDTFEFKRDSYIAIDLTRAFGAGNEPDSPEKVVAALGLDPSAQYPYCAGEVRHAAVDNVMTEGRNILPHVWHSGALSNTTGEVLSRPSPDYNAYTDPIVIGNGVYYAYNPSANPEYMYCYCYDNNDIFIGRSTVTYIQNKTFGQLPGTAYVRFMYYNSGSTFYVDDLSPACISRSNNRDGEYTSYLPPIVHPIPESVLALPSYGWSAGTAKNHIYRDGKRWMYKQEVASVDLDTKTIHNFESNTEPCKYFSINGAGAKSYGQFISSDDNIAYTSQTGATLIRLFYRAGMVMSETPNPTGMFCYELVEPIVTDITDLMGSALDLIDLSDEFGSITFENSQKAAVPNTTTFTRPKTQTAGKQSMFAITEDMCTVTKDPTKGVAPYSTSYGMTYIEIDKDAGVEWVEGGMYTFAVSSKLVVDSAYRNVAIRIGGADDGDVWHPLTVDTGGILAGSSYFTKGVTRYYQYKTTYIATGALHVGTDSNTTYAYLVNDIAANSNGSSITIDSNGYGARYSLIFPTTPASELINERWSSLVTTSSNATTKAVNNIVFYADRNPLYVYSANVVAGAKPLGALYQDYANCDLRYTANVNNTYLTAFKRAFLWLKDFNPSDYSFKADATVGNIMSQDKIATRFPETVAGDIYLYYLGRSNATWYQLQPEFAHTNRIFKYTPSTGEMAAWDGAAVKKAELWQRAGIIVMTQEEYDLLESPDDGTLYIIVEDQG